MRSTPAGPEVAKRRKSQRAWRRDRWEALARWEVAAGRLSAKYGLDCYGERGEQCHECTRKVSDFRRKPAGYPHWPECPNRLIQSHYWRYSVGLWNAQQIAPITGWTSDYAAWVPESLTHLPAALREEAKREAEASKTGTGPPLPVRGGGGRKPWL